MSAFREILRDFGPAQAAAVAQRVLFSMWQNLKIA